jgi:peptidyl-prolyl cis-trans isomerase B (cyclophilin B)
VSKRTRNRQLARLAQQRQMDRLRRQRRKQLTTIAVALVVALAGSTIAAAAFLRSGDDTQAAGPSGATTSPTGASGLSGSSGTSGDTGPSGPTPDGKPGTQTGTVKPTPGPEEVACGASAPPAASKPKPQFNAPARVLQKGKSYTATVQTSCGDIVIRLLADSAPQTVNSFVFLAEHGFFDGTRIHRIDTSIDVLQGGDPTGTGTGGPGYTIPDELSGQDTYGPGTLAMANAGPNTGGSQFFLIVGDKGHNLDASPNYTVFGQIVKGLDVGQKIERIPIQQPGGDISGQQPSEAVYIEKVTISTS